MRAHESPPSLKRAVSSESNGSSTSHSSSGSSKRLLFGEIPTPATSAAQSSRSLNSICNLVLSTSSSFLRFWLSDECRNNFLSHVEQENLPNLRLVCHDFATKAAPALFEDISISFRPSTFTRPARMAALDRIGDHVKTLQFNMPHSAETFLPPVIDTETGEERTFFYEPQVHRHSSLAARVKQPKYGSWEMTDLLITQYPPLFHAATNIPAFVRAFSAFTSLNHLKIHCPGQEQSQRYRRDIVDYALISLRIAIERAPLYQLETLSFLSIHPAGLLYLQPILGYGATPSSSRRWAQIKKLNIHMDSFPVSKHGRTEHLRLLHSYLRTFAPNLNRLFFRWRGDKGPCPFTLNQEPCMQPSAVNHTSFKDLPMRPLKFRKLEYMELENATTDASQISHFIAAHRRTLKEFNFEDVSLRKGTWDEALSPLTVLTGNEEWKKKAEEVMDVPLILSPVDVEARVVDTAVEETKSAQRNGITLSRWLSKGRRGAVATKAKEQLWGGSEHMKRFLRTSVFTWR